MSRYDRPDDDVEELLARRRRRNGRKPVWVAAGVFGVLVALMAVAVVVVVAKRNRDAGGGAPAAGLFGPNADDMTYRELYEHLRGKGLDLRFVNGRKGIYFTTDKVTDEASLLALIEDTPIWPDDVIRVEQTPNAEFARQSAGTVTGGSYHFKRWLFYGDEKLLAKVRAALSR